jgi:hypothetical protein
MNGYYRHRFLSTLAVKRRCPAINFEHALLHAHNLPRGIGNPPLELHEAPGGSD